MLNEIITKRVDALRNWMERHNALQAFIIPTADPHNSEYLADHWKCREWLTGFTGSAGIAVVTKDAAALWTDSRYWLQAAEQLEGTPFQLMRDGDEGVPTLKEWLCAQLPARATVGCFGGTITMAEYTDLLEDASYQLTAAGEDPFDELWTNRPALPQRPLVLQPLEYTGMSVDEKITLIWKNLKETEPQALLLSDLSEIAWTLNLRGDDIEFNPVFMSYLLLRRKGNSVLFVDEHQLTPAVSEYLQENHIEVHPYDGWKDAFQTEKGGIALPHETNVLVMHAAVSTQSRCPFVSSPVPMLRAIKTPAEQQGFRRSMEKDGCAMVRFLAKLRAPSISPIRGSAQQRTNGKNAFQTASPDIYAKLKEYARENRAHATEAEEALWQILQGKNLGFDFRRQHIIGDFIADFVCLKKNLIIEVDGRYHSKEQQIEIDANRTEFLISRGFRVIRFTNEEIIANTESVLNKIRFELTKDEFGQLTELSIDFMLTSEREKEEGFCGLSFATIAAYGPHGAIVHYEATPQTAVSIPSLSTPPHGGDGGGFLLLDSGAQYVDGTTDITRTLPCGPLTDEERRVYTLVLKGHIALSSARFPIGTSGLELDYAARRAMWQEGYDFGHGTGHGVGAHLCVHEGPHQIRKNVRNCTLVGFRPGMTITNEPGLYVSGKFGVRIENTLLVVDDGETPFGHFCRFEPLTLCPIDLRPIVREMLTPEEICWLNNYHAEVRRRLLPLLPDSAHRAWLEEATREF